MMLTFIVFTFGSLLVAVQIAGGQMTPRIMAATLLRDNAIRFSVGARSASASAEHGRPAASSP
ncbi:hypothetical protein [Mesorhizobium sp. LjNodule214]|uniref:Uncharacterized protein n=2 Tax=Mesorhizobium delmotii TaxID=1631247 RepID=A0A2P9ATB1_9HYPH|nr:hypothetical protein BQ8482_410001 [Mesorhizobium delmotii]